MDILIVDSHPMLVSLYERLLHRDLRRMDELNITTAKDCKEAYNTITDAETNNFDLAIINQNIPAYDEMGMRSGTDIVKLLRETHHNCKILIVTSHTEVLLVYDILKKAKPDGLAINNDLTDDNFEPMVHTVLSGNLFRSKLVQACVDKVWEREIMVEENNRQILLLLSKGYRIEDMQPAIKLAPRTIKKKIGEIRRSFGVTDNLTLIRAAMANGLL